MSFPHNYEMYLEKAMNCMQTDDLAGAIASLKKAIAIEMEEEVLHLCVSLLRDLNQQEEAYQVLITYQPHLVDSSELTVLDIEYIELLIETNRIEESEQQLRQRHMLLANTPALNQLNMMLEEKLMKKKLEKEQQLEQKIRDVEAKLHTISEDAYYLQIKWVKQLVELPNEWLVKIANSVLKGTLHPLLKTEIISELQDRKMKERLLIVKHQFEGQIDLNTLLPLKHSSFYLEGLSTIEQALELSFSEIDRLQKNFFLHCAYFYPFEEEAFLSVDSWLAFFHDNQSTAVSSEVKKNIRLSEAGLDLFT